MRDTLIFSGLKGGQKFVVLPGKDYNPRRDGDYLKESYLFLKIKDPSNNAVRVCDGRPFKIPDNVPVFRVKDSGKAARRRRRR